MSGWLLLRDNWATFQLYNSNIELHFEEIMMMSTTYKTSILSSIFIALTHCNKSPLGQIVLIPVQPVICSYSVMSFDFDHRREATNTNFIVFGLTRPGFESTIYRTRCHNEESSNLLLTTGAKLCQWQQ